MIFGIFTSDYGRFLLFWAPSVVLRKNLRLSTRFWRSLFWNSENNSSLPSGFRKLFISAKIVVSKKGDLISSYSLQVVKGIGLSREHSVSIGFE